MGQTHAFLMSFQGPTGDPQFYLQRQKSAKDK